MISVIFFSIFCLGSIAQTGTITGVVLHEDAPVNAATIEIKKIRKVAISGPDGTFTLTNVPAGNHVLHISVVGFEPVHENIQLHDGEQLTRSIKLNATATSLNEVVVSGTMRAVHKKESPILVEVYTPQFFKKNPTPSIFEALQNVNGVRPQLNCNVCNTGDIHINGLEGPYTMITIDGMPIVSSLSSVYGLFGIPTQLIERIEIVKGPASGLYGSEAIGGLINIITKSPDKAPTFTANVMSTSWMEHSIDAGVKLKLGNKAHSLIGVNYFNYSTPKDKNEDGFTDVTLQDRISIFTKTSFLRKSDRIASVAARYFYEDRWGGEMNWNKSFRGGDSVYGESIYTNRWELIGNYQLPVNEKILFSASATSHDQDSYYGTMSYMAKQHILFGQLVWDKPISANHNMLVGAATRFNHYDDNSTATIDTVTGTNTPERSFVPGFFIQDEWKLNGSHMLLMGIRYDHHSVHKHIITPRMAYKWMLNDKNIIRINAGTGFRVVSLFTEEHAALTGARKVVITESLKPEKSYNINLNYSTQLSKNKTILNLDISAWYTYFHNQIIPDYKTDPNKIIYSNLKGHALSRGLTFNLEGQLSRRLRLMTGITVQDVAKYDRDHAGNKLRSPLLLTEKWSGTWAVTYTTPAAKMNIDYTGNIYGPMELPLLSPTDPRDAQSPVWSIQNLQLTRKTSSGFEFFAGVKNILNWTPAKNNPFIIARSHDPFDKKVDYDNAGNVIATTENPYGLTFDPSYVYAPNQGRRGFVGVRYQVK